MKSKMLHIWHPDAKLEKERKAKKVAKDEGKGKTKHVKRMKKKYHKGRIAHIVHADAKISKAMLSINHDKGRAAITARCTMADGSTKVIGIVEVRKIHAANFAHIAQQMFEIANGPQMTKGQVHTAKDMLLAE